LEREGFIFNGDEKDVSEILNIFSKRGREFEFKEDEVC
jgi:hypothetical protein